MTVLLDSKLLKTNFSKKITSPENAVELEFSRRAIRSKLRPCLANDLMQKIVYPQEQII